MRTVPANTGLGAARVVWLLVFAAVFVWSAIDPRDYPTWALEVAPAVGLAGAVVYAWLRFPPTPLLAALILVHSIILMVGGHYTYAEVPIADTIGEWLGFERNNYDKLGHFAQGFVPAIIAREILIRNAVVPSPRWRAFIIVSICLAFSAFYELIEWFVALLTGESAEAFLGTQGFAWDTQTDMAFALLGAVVALVTLARWHDRQLAALD